MSWCTCGFACASRKASLLLSPCIAGNIGKGGYSGGLATQLQFQCLGTVVLALKCASATTTVASHGSAALGWGDLSYPVPPQSHECLTSFWVSFLIFGGIFPYKAWSSESQGSSTATSGTCQWMTSLLAQIGEPGCISQEPTVWLWNVFLRIDTGISCVWKGKNYWKSGCQRHISAFSCLCVWCHPALVWASLEVLGGGSGAHRGRGAKSGERKC